MGLFMETEVIRIVLSYIGVAYRVFRGFNGIPFLVFFWGKQYNE